MVYVKLVYVWVRDSDNTIYLVAPDTKFCTCLTGKVDEKATQLHAIASLKVLLDATKPQDGANGTATCAGEGNNIGGGGDQAHDSGRASQGTEVGGD